MVCKVVVGQWMDQPSEAKNPDESSHICQSSYRAAVGQALTNADVIRKGGLFFGVRISVVMAGIEGDVIQLLIDAAHRNCPNSKATRGERDVHINLT